MRRTTRSEWRLAWGPGGGGSFTPRPRQTRKKRKREREEKNSVWKNSTGEEKEEIVMLLIEWRSEPSRIMNWTDCVEEESQEEREEEKEAEG